MAAATNNAVLNALDILDLLGRSPNRLRLMDIAEELHLHETTTHRLLASLAERGYVQQPVQNGPYALGWKVVTLARLLGDRARLAQDVRPHLEALLRQLQQTVNLAVLNNSDVMYLDCLTPNHPVSVYTPPGALAPAHATSLGKALLAFLPKEDLESLLPQLKLEPRTPSTITSLPKLRAALEQVRQRRYAIDEGELKTDVNCIAVAITDPNGHSVAAISVTAQANGLKRTWEREVSTALIATARKAAADLF